MPDVHSFAEQGFSAKVIDTGQATVDGAKLLVFADIISDFLSKPNEQILLGVARE